jgi:hypothetical protein
MAEMPKAAAANASRGTRIPGAFCRPATGLGLTDRGWTAPDQAYAGEHFMAL